MQRKELVMLPSSMVPSFARGINILVVDHDTTSLMYLASMLEQYSYKVTTTELSSVALSMIRQDKDRFELVMANVNMSNTNSHLFLRVLLKEEIPVILMSSARSMAVSWRALVEGACFFLEKPISLDDLKYVWQHAYKRRTKIPSEKPEMILQYSINDQNGESNMLDDEISIKESQNNCIMEQHLMANDRSQKQGGFKTNRSLLGDDQDKEREKENGKKRKLNSDNENYKNIMIPTEVIGEEMNVNNNGNVKRKRNPRIIWTPELHLKFTEAVSALGDIKARPKQILQKMNVQGLRQRQVASHLQKYKTQVQQISDNATTDLASTSKNIPSSIYATNTGSMQTLEKIKPSMAPYQPTLKSKVFEAKGKTQGAGIVQVENDSGSSSNVADSGNLKVNTTVVPETPAASSVNQNQPSSEYADLLKLLDEDEDEDEIIAGLGGEPKPADLDRYCEWLTEALMEDSQHSE